MDNELKILESLLSTDNFVKFLSDFENIYQQKQTYIPQNEFESFQNLLFSLVSASSSIEIFYENNINMDFQIKSVNKNQKRGTSQMFKSKFFKSKIEEFLKIEMLNKRDFNNRENDYLKVKSNPQFFNFDKNKSQNFVFQFLVSLNLLFEEINLNLVLNGETKKQKENQIAFIVVNLILIVKDHDISFFYDKIFYLKKYVYFLQDKDLKNQILFELQENNLQFTDKPPSDSVFSVDQFLQDNLIDDHLIKTSFQFKTIKNILLALSFVNSNLKNKIFDFQDHILWIDNLKDIQIIFNKGIFNEKQIYDSLITLNILKQDDSKLQINQKFPVNIQRHLFDIFKPYFTIWNNYQIRIQRQLTEEEIKEEKQNLKKKIQQIFIEKESSCMEAEELLNCQRIMTLRTNKIPSFLTLSDQEQKDKKQKLIEKNFIGHLSKTIGSGILNFSSSEISQTDRILFKNIEQRGFSVEDQSYVSINNITKEKLLEIETWPSFHNGVSRLSPYILSLKDQSEKTQDFLRSWILQHTPRQPSSDHAGFLLAIGLSGMLKYFTRTDIYNQMKSMHEQTNIAILIGYSASQLRSSHELFTKTLATNITYLHPPNLTTEIALTIQSAALISTGLLYLETQDKAPTEMLVTQIGRKPINDRAVERQLYALSAGIALGFVNLGAGSKLETKYPDLQIEQRLIRFIEGGPQMEVPRAMLPQKVRAESTQCSSIKESDQVNILVTGSGGLFALTLIYLQSENEKIVERIKVPQTVSELDQVRPSFLMQKIISKNLIMWDQITPSQEWIHKQVPDLIQFAYTNTVKDVNLFYQDQLGSDRLDFATISLCREFIMTGACIVMAIKYAGTCDQDVMNILYKRIEELKNAKVCSKPTPELLYQIYNDSTKFLIDRSTQENCLANLGMAIGLVMAGSGDAKCFRQLRVLRKKLEAEMNYGCYMAVGIGIGLLFVGKGLYAKKQFPAFDRFNKFTIACLLCTLYPVLPRDPKDNENHLQALRHFYLLVLNSPDNYLYDQLQNQEISKNQSFEIPTSNKDKTLSKEQKYQILIKAYCGQTNTEDQLLKEIQDELQKY